MSNLTYEFAVEGAAASLEHAGRFVRTAASLFFQGNYDAATVIAALAAEALGQFHLLIEVAERIRKGEALDLTAVSIKDHPRRQKNAHTGVTTTEEEARQLIALGNQMFDAPTAEEREAANKQMIRQSAKLAKTANSNRDAMRQRASYVNLERGDSWSRPSEISKKEAEKVVYEAANGYSLLWGRVRLAPHGAMGHEGIARAFGEWVGIQNLPEPPDLASMAAEAQSRQSELR